MATKKSNGLADTMADQWNRLVSTTNWEKGRIICQMEDEAACQGSEVYSDENWARLVGGITGQLVTRLRQTYRRFSNDIDHYENLYWSHFNAASNWEDADYWLERANDQKLSVSQMRMTQFAAE